MLRYHAENGLFEGTILIHAEDLGGKVLSRFDVISAWLSSGTALADFIDALRTHQARLKPDREGLSAAARNALPGIPANPFRLEMPVLCPTSMGRSFQCALLFSPELESAPSWQPFARQLDQCLGAVAQFENLSRDAWLLAPKPRHARDDFAHLSRFLKHADHAYCSELFRAAATQALRLSQERPIWFNTAGAGVPWLHLRLDQRPKYYRHLPFASLNG